MKQKCNCRNWWLIAIFILLLLLVIMVASATQLPAQPVQPQLPEENPFPIVIEPWEISHKPIITQTTTDSGSSHYTNYCEGEKVIEKKYESCKDYKIVFGKEWNWLKWKTDYYVFIETTNYKKFMKEEGQKVLDGYRFNVKLIGDEKGVVDIKEL